MREHLERAVLHSDLDLVDRWLAEGVDINEPDTDGQTILSTYILLSGEAPDRHAIVRSLLERGADPRLLDEERGGPLQAAMLRMDTEMLQLLLEHGADPNSEAGFTQSETLYDWAVFDYRYQVYDLRLPEDPTVVDQQSEEAWLKYLQRLAEKYDRRRPDHLFLLRRYGARASHELPGGGAETHL